jgi:hypothetical protein
MYRRKEGRFVWKLKQTKKYRKMLDNPKRKKKN